MPCPYDPKHSVFRKQLQRHLRKCPAKPPPTPPYFSKGHNRPGQAVAGGDHEGQGAEPLPAGLRDASAEELQNLIARVKRLADKHCRPMTADAVRRHPSVDEEIRDRQAQVRAYFSCDST